MNKSVCMFYVHAYYVQYIVMFVPLLPGQASSPRGSKPNCNHEDAVAEGISCGPGAMFERFDC